MSELITNLLQLVIIGLLIWVVRCFGAYARNMAAICVELSHMRDENRRFRESQEPTTRKSA